MTITIPLTPHPKLSGSGMSVASVNITITLNSYFINKTIQWTRSIHRLIENYKMSAAYRNRGQNLTAEDQRTLLLFLYSCWVKTISQEVIPFIIIAIRSQISGFMVH